MSASENIDLDAAVNMIMLLPSEKERDAIIATFSKTKQKKIRQMIRAREGGGKDEEDKDKGDDSKDDDKDKKKEGKKSEFPPPPEDSDSGVTTPKTEPPPANPDDVTDDDIKQMWTVIDTYDVSKIDPKDLLVFEYEGFNPDEIMKSLMKQQRINKISQATFLRDIAVLCGLAIVKGSVNDNNYKKMKKEGQDAYQKLAARYGIKLGTAKGQSSEVVTVSRIAATFPGIILKLLHDKKVSARDFMGPLKSSKLPAIIRHQALAACIPRELSEDTKNFLLSAVIAFSVDQSMSISTKKLQVDDVIKTQSSFIKVAHSGRYPPEKIRTAIFRTYNWDDHYQAISECVRELAKKDDSFKIVDQAQFKSDINKL